MKTYSMLIESPYALTSIMDALYSESEKLGAFHLDEFRPIKWQTASGEITRSSVTAIEFSSLHDFATVERLLAPGDETFAASLTLMQAPLAHNTFTNREVLTEGDFDKLIVLLNPVMLEDQLTVQ